MHGNRSLTPSVHTIICRRMNKNRDSNVFRTFVHVRMFSQRKKGEKKHERKIILYRPRYARILGKKFTNKFKSWLTNGEGFFSTVRASR